MFCVIWVKLLPSKAIYFFILMMSQCVSELTFLHTQIEYACHDEYTVFFGFKLVFVQMSLGGSSVAVVQLPGGQFQVQGVIQSAQSSVIQSPQMQSSQVRPPGFIDTAIIDSKW